MGPKQGLKQAADFQPQSEYRQQLSSDLDILLRILLSTPGHRHGVRWWCCVHQNPLYIEVVTQILAIGSLQGTVSW